jgi:anti-sigma factor RsiW
LCIEENNYEEKFFEFTGATQVDRRIVDDEQLTAYALGELEGADWAAAEQRIAQDESARKYVEDVRAAARLMSEGLSAQPSPGLDDTNREAIENHIEIRTRSKYGPGTTPKGIRMGVQPMLFALAAVVAIGLIAFMWPSSRAPKPLATQPTFKGHIPITIEHEPETTRPIDR